MSGIISYLASDWGFEIKSLLLRANKEGGQSTALKLKHYPRNSPRIKIPISAFGCVMLMFDGGKRFTPSMLSFPEPKSEAADFIKSSQTHSRVNDPAHCPRFTKDGCNKVESEKTYQAPVKGAYKK
jgi:hypothetical protein